MTKLKLAAVAALSVVAVAAPLLVQHQSLPRLHEENRRLQAQQGSLAQLAAENQRLANLVASVDREREDRVRELLRLRGEVASLREQSKELEQLRKENRELRTSAPPPHQELVASDDAARDSCIDQLKQISGAIQQYALEHNLSEDDRVTAEQIAPYLKNYTDAVFRCPTGGTYIFGVVTNTPACTVSGHSIPTDWVKKNYFQFPPGSVAGQ